MAQSPRTQSCGGGHRPSEEPVGHEEPLFRPIPSFITLRPVISTMVSILRGVSIAISVVWFIEFVVLNRRITGEWEDNSTLWLSGGNSRDSQAYQLPILRRSSVSDFSSVKKIVPFDHLVQVDGNFFGKDVDWEKIYGGFHSKKYVSYELLKQYPMSDPYTLKWEPRDRLENWAKNKKGDRKKQVPFGSDICFVHVGKAAGSSLGSLLGFQLHNREIDYSIPEDGLLPKYTTHVMHNLFNDCADDTPYYLWNVRSPLQRLISAFAYDRDKNHNANKYFYQTCFQTLNSLGEALDLPNEKHSKYCQARAFSYVTGLDRRAGHAFSNLRRYYYEAFRNAKNLTSSKILVIRSEHFESDYQAAERKIASQQYFPDTQLSIPSVNAKQKSEQDKFLSQLSTQNLCHALCPEIQIYKYLLRTAINLDEDDYHQSMTELQEDCPLEAINDSCPFFPHRSNN